MELSGIYRAFIGCGILTKTESLLLKLERFRLHEKEFWLNLEREFRKIDKALMFMSGKFKARRREKKNLW